MSSSNMTWGESTIVWAASRSMTVRCRSPPQVKLNTYKLKQSTKKVSFSHTVTAIDGCPTDGNCWVALTLRVECTHTARGAGATQASLDTPVALQVKQIGESFMESLQDPDLKERELSQPIPSLVTTFSMKHVLTGSLHKKGA